MKKWAGKIALQNENALAQTHARFRTGSHALMIETGRAADLAWQDRCCPFCTTAAVEDEAHMIFDCPTYATIRSSYSVLFSDTTNGSVARFMTQEKQAVVGKYLKECVTYRRREYDALEIE